MSDTSVLVALVQLGLLHVLHQLHGEVLIPPAVRDEFAAGADETTRRAEFRRTFYEGTSAEFDAETSELTVVNTQDEIDLVDAINQGCSASRTLRERLLLAIEAVFSRDE